ncbi:hypothetical protein, partial [Bradyrhizobium sp. sGM-13]|uniref:hypothetical protein n=1 Tax=Bradyrhizobium sp. sGM-13 TaxID=2831781 RepID=UPI001BCACFB8
DLDLLLRYRRPCGNTQQNGQPGQLQRLLHNYSSVRRLCSQPTLHQMLGVQLILAVTAAASNNGAMQAMRQLLET